jgi:hydroxyacyl-ACP dehydratase HTD2-like protein with hotdog domain
MLFEDIVLGENIPSIIRRTTTRQLVKWGCLRDEFYELHYDKDYAIGLGFSGVLVQGELVASFIEQMLISWLGDKGSIRKFDYNFRIPILVNEDILCKGKVVNKYVRDEQKYLECEIWAVNKEGKKTVSGTAVIVFYE